LPTLRRGARFASDERAYVGCEPPPSRPTTGLRPLSSRRMLVEPSNLSEDRASVVTDSPKPSRLRPLARTAFEWVFGREGRIGSTVYGTIIVLTALTASYAAERHDPWKLVELVVTTVVVFFVAYVYAQVLSEGIEGKNRLSGRGVSRVATRELGLLLAALAPIVALLLGAAGTINERESIWLAIAFGFITLSAQGVRYARATGLGRLGTALILLSNLVFGAFVVLLKVALVH
jgi:hypothetical protein